ncbi:hypothetical protein D3C80_1879110 [compost metagenome]
MFKAVLPVGVLESDREQGVACECQPLAAGRHINHAVPWGVAPGALDDHARCHLMLIVECPNPAAVFAHELIGGCP